MNRNVEYLKSTASATLLTLLVGATSPVEAFDPDETIWEGFYFGGVLGAGHADAKVSPDSDNDRGDPGCLAGFDLGYNWDQDNWAWGVELDFVMPDMQPGAGGGQHDLTVDTMSTLRARAGYKCGPHLVFATAGAGLLTGIHDSSDGDHRTKFCKARGVVGVGVEHMATDHISVKAEGLAYFGCNKWTPASDGPEELRHIYTARLGINFHF